MKAKYMGIILLVLLCACMPLVSFAADVQTTIKPQKDVLYVHVGKSTNLRLQVSPRAARAKGVIFQSDNESVATVTSRGKVTGVSMGSCNVTVTSKYDESVSIKVPVNVIVPAKKVTLTVDNPVIRVGETVATLHAAFEPVDTSVQEVTYKSTNSHIATVDEEGVVTGIKPGKVAIVATAIDGGKARAKINLTVVQPVAGVSFKTPHVRVGVNYRGSFTAALEPKNASNKNMTWVSSDPSVAVVTGSTNRMRIQGKKWGQCTITGTTEDGGFEVTIVADIGSLRRAIKPTQVVIRDGQPRLTFRNDSNMNITQIRYLIRGFDVDGEPIQMSRKQDWLAGTYDVPLSQGQSTQHGRFHFINQIPYYGLYRYEVAITGWSTDTGYYNSQGQLCYDYNNSQQNYEWISSYQ